MTRFDIPAILSKLPDKMRKAVRMLDPFPDTPPFESPFCRSSCRFKRVFLETAALNAFYQEQCGDRSLAEEIERFITSVTVAPSKQPPISGLRHLKKQLQTRKVEVCRMKRSLATFFGSSTCS